MLREQNPWNSKSHFPRFAPLFLESAVFSAFSTLLPDLGMWGEVRRGLGANWQSTWGQWPHLHVPVLLLLVVSREVQAVEGKKLAESWGATFLESSARENQVLGLMTGQLSGGALRGGWGVGLGAGGVATELADFPPATLSLCSQLEASSSKSSRRLRGWRTPTGRSDDAISRDCFWVLPGSGGRRRCGP